MEAEPRVARDNEVAELRRLVRQLEAARRSLDEYRLRSEALINSIGEGLIVMDERGTITAVNPYTLAHLGFEHDELIGQWFPGALVAVDRYSQPIEPLDRPIIRALSTGQAISDYIHYIKKDQTIIPVFVTASPILIDERPVGAIEVFRDLTQERQLDIAKDEFVSLASHQLRTPATGVKSILSMLVNGDFGELAPTQKKYVRRAIEANDRQLHIIEDLLSAARIDAGKMEAEKSLVDLVKLIKSVVEDHRPAIERRAQRLRLHLPERATIMADGPKLRMVLDNLISNASKYSKDHGTIEVELTMGTRTVVMKVCDEGVGIASENIPKLFQKFSRFDNELSTLVGGSGLGLFLVKSIVELHNGSIAVSSRPDRGSIFEVTLPRARETQ